MTHGNSRRANYLVLAHFPERRDKTTLLPPRDWEKPGTNLSQRGVLPAADNLMVPPCRSCQRLQARQYTSPSNIFAGAHRASPRALENGSRSAGYPSAVSHWLVNIAIAKDWLDRLLTWIESVGPIVFEPNDRIRVLHRTVSPGRVLRVNTTTAHRD
jgi:hypothetical protein